MFKGLLLQTSGLSSPEWVTVFSNVVMAATSLALVLYAGLAIREAKRDRRKDSIEKQLEKLYNPMFEILDQVLLEQTDEEKSQHAVKMVLENYRKLQDILLNYGHYLDPTMHDEIRRLLLFPDLEIGPFRNYDDRAFRKSLGYIREKREEMIAELRKLS